MSITPPVTGIGGTANTLVDTTMTVNLTGGSVSGTINNGDFVLVYVSGNNGTATAPSFTAPAGWAQIGSTVVDGSSPQLAGALYYRFRQSGDTTTPVWTINGGGANVVYDLVAYPGVDPTTPWTGFSIDPYAGTNTAKTTATVTTAGGWVVSGFSDRNGGIYTALADTLRCTSTHSSGSSAVLQDSNGNVTAGSQVRTATGPSTSVGISFIIGLNAAATAGASVDTVTAAMTAYDIFPAADPLGRLLFRLGTSINVAHRGLSASAVEHTAAAYALCDSLGIIAREMSVWRSSDGVWVASHDRTTGRVFGAGQNIDIPTNTWAAIQAATAAGTTVGNFPIAKMVDLINASPADKVWWVDNKNSTNITDFLDTLDAFTNAQGRFLIKAVFNSGVPAVARLRGYRSWGYWYEADLGSFDTYKGNFHYHGLDYLASGAAWAQVLADGKPVLSHVTLTKAAYDTGTALGATGSMTGLASNFPNAQAEGVVVAMTAYDMAPTGVPTGTAGGTASFTFTATGGSTVPEGGTAAISFVATGNVRAPDSGGASITFTATGGAFGPGGAGGTAQMTFTGTGEGAGRAPGATASMVFTASAGASVVAPGGVAQMAFTAIGFAQDATLGFDVTVVITLAEQSDLPDLVQWRLPAETKEFLGPITVTVNGTPTNAFELTLTKDAGRPTLWKAPRQVTGGLGLLVGLGTDFPLSVGHKHTLWARISSMPEVPVQRIGLVRVF